MNDIPTVLVPQTTTDYHITRSKLIKGNEETILGWIRPKPKDAQKMHNQLSY